MNNITSEKQSDIHSPPVYASFGNSSSIMCGTSISVWPESSCK